ncbi:MAG TPA: hypothetical protein V6D37_18380 [Candidatus Sericytochromatia bacterium]|jgi:hypothetical protein
MPLSTNTQSPLTQSLNLPTRNKWTHRAIAEYLHCSRATVAIYATTICPVISDFRAECPRDVKGGIKSGFSLSQYQFWVLTKTIMFARLLKADLNGASYRQELKQTICKGQAHLSRAAYRYELEMQDDSAA